MTTCARCGSAFTPSGRRRFCSDACRQADWRARHVTPPLAEPPAATRPADIVYECPSCEQRYLGTRRCEDCNLFCRRIGPGGSCPHCSEPVALGDLGA